MFDVEGARKAGYSDAEIADHLGKSSKFDVGGARKSGYTDSEILSHLTSQQKAGQKAVEAKASPTFEALKREFKGSVPVSLAAGLGRGVGNVALGAQRLVGKGAQSVGLQSAGDWLVSDAEAGQKAMDAEFKPYQEASPMASGFGKLGGEVLATLPVGGALAAPLRGVAPGVAQAIQTAGFRGPNMAARAVGGGVVGGANMALVDPENIGTGAAIGAALPGAVKVAGLAGEAVGKVARPVVEAVSSKAAKSGAVRKVSDALGPNVNQAIADIQAYRPANAQSIPVSAPGVTGNADLARLEQASRLRATPAWSSFDEKQAKAVADNVMDATREAGQLSQRFSDRAANWAKNWADASSNVNQRVFEQGLVNIKSAVNAAKKTPDAVNGRVASALDEIEGTLEKFGQGFTPEHLQKLRAEFNGKIKPMARNAMEAVPRDSHAIKSIIKSFDDILNATTSGKWDVVKKGYADDTAKVHASKAAQIVRDKFIEPSTGMPVRAAGTLGDIAKMTEAQLMGALKQAANDQGKTELSKQAAAKIEATLEAVRRQNIVQRTKQSATAGGGSDTMSNALSVTSIPGNNWMLTTLDAIGKMGTAKREALLADLLQNPDALAIELAKRRGGTSLGELMAPVYRGAPLLAADR